MSLWQSHYPAIAVALLSHQRSFMGIELMRRRGHPNGSNASRREKRQQDPSARDTDCVSTQSMACLSCGVSAWLEMLWTVNKSWELQGEGLVCMELS